MATQQDLELAKRLLSARVLTEDQMRAAFGLIGQYEEQGKRASLEAVLYHKGLLPRGSLQILRAPPVLQSQPFSNYRLERLLGEGGSSSVYRATYIPNGTLVAVKVLDPIQALRPTFLQRFQQEAQTLIELEHDHIVLGYEVGFENGYHFFSMDLVDGLTVLEVIDRRGFLENEEALSIILQAARAIEYLHASGYLHRDIKPGNIMVAADGHARMIDLGLIRSLPKDGGTPEEEDDAMTVGTVEYLSPEQARGHSDLDPRSDIYSLGVSLYHMVVGEVPFQGENDYETMAKQVLSALDTQKVKQRRIAPEVHFFITKMTSKDRDMRFETVHDVLEAVAGYVPSGIAPVDLGSAPVAPPVAPAVAPPVAAPVAPPVVAPVAPPVAPPVAAPVAAPVVQPVAAGGPPRAARPITPKPTAAKPIAAKPVAAKPAAAQPVKGDPVAPAPAAPVVKPAPVKPVDAPASPAPSADESKAKHPPAPTPRRKRGRRS